MDLQTAFNVAGAIVLLLLGWLFVINRNEMNDVKKDNKDLNDKLNATALKLAEEYVHKNDFKDFMDVIYKKLDMISNKLDGKADK